MAFTPFSVLEIISSIKDVSEHILPYELYLE